MSGTGVVIFAVKVFVNGEQRQREGGNRFQRAEGSRTRAGGKGWKCVVGCVGDCASGSSKLQGVARKMATNNELRFDQ